MTPRAPCNATSTKQAFLMPNQSHNAATGNIWTNTSTVYGLPPQLLLICISLHGTDPHLYLSYKAVLIIFDINSDRLIISYIAAYFYDVYFSIIVLKVGLKLISILLDKIKYERYRRAVIITFILFEVLLTGALIYESV